MTRSSPIHLFLLLIFLICSAHTRAEPIIHKCVDASGIASYQNLACDESQQQAWSRNVAMSLPATDPGPAAAAMPSSKPRHGGAGRAHKMPGRRRDGESSPSGQPSGPGKGRRSKPPSSDGRRGTRYSTQAALIPLNPKADTSSCLSARRRREDTLARVGWKRSYSLLQKLDDGVQRACQ